jgi:hypothetical protein
MWIPLSFIFTLLYYKVKIKERQKDSEKDLSVVYRQLSIMKGRGVVVGFSR